MSERSWREDQNVSLCKSLSRQQITTNHRNSKILKLKEQKKSSQECPRKPTKIPQDSEKKTITIPVCQPPLFCSEGIFQWRGGGYISECTAVAAIQLRMRMRILTRPEDSLAKFSRQISKKKLRIKRCEGIC